MKPCAAPGCRQLVEVGTPHCDRHHVDVKAERGKVSDRDRADKPSRRWYKLTAWKGQNGRRLVQLRKDPLCALCPAWSRQAASIADHVIPHREDHGAFWFGPLQSLCKPCHDIKKQRAERRAERAGGGSETVGRTMPGTGVGSQIFSRPN